MCLKQTYQLTARVVSEWYILLQVINEPHCLATDKVGTCLENARVCKVIMTITVQHVLTSCLVCGYCFFDFTSVYKKKIKLYRAAQYKTCQSILQAFWGQFRQWWWDDLSLHNLTLEDAIKLALNKPLWRLLAASGATHWWCTPDNDDDDDGETGKATTLAVNRAHSVLSTQTKTG